MADAWTDPSDESPIEFLTSLGLLSGGRSGGGVHRASTRDHSGLTGMPSGLRHILETDDSDWSLSGDAIPQEDPDDGGNNKITDDNHEIADSLVVGRAIVVLFTRKPFSILWIATMFFAMSALFALNLFELYIKIGISWADLVGASLSALAGALIVSLFFKIKMAVK